MWIRSFIVLGVIAGVAWGQESGGARDEEVKAESSVSITYLANEGVFVESGGRGVLIDALFRGGVAGYARVPAAELEKIETARPPYDTVRLVLVSHYHPDHFDPESVLRHLKHNTRARLISSKQVVDKVLALPDVDDAIRKRIRAVAPREKEKVTIEGPGPKVEFIRLSHGEGRFAKIWNLGMIVHLGGKRILHIGDASRNPKTTEPLAMHARGVDVACIPDWILTSTRGGPFVRDRLAPKRVVAIHIRPAKAEAVAEQVRAAFPKAVVFTKPMTTERF